MSVRCPVEHDDLQFPKRNSQTPPVDIGCAALDSRFLFLVLNRSVTKYRVHRSASRLTKCGIGNSPFESFRDTLGVFLGDRCRPNVRGPRQPTKVGSRVLEIHSSCLVGRKITARKACNFTGLANVSRMRCDCHHIQAFAGIATLHMSQQTRRLGFCALLIESKFAGSALAMKITGASIEPLPPKPSPQRTLPQEGPRYEFSFRAQSRSC